MDKKEIESLIAEKEQLFKAVKNHSDKLVELKSEYKYATEDIWLHTEWESAITNAKPTEKSKKAYVDGQLREIKEEVEYTENVLTATYHEIEIIDDKLKYLSGVNDD